MISSKPETTELGRSRSGFANCLVNIKRKPECFYAALAQADKEARIIVLVEFMLQSLLKPVATDQVKSVINTLCMGLLSTGDLIVAIGLSRSPTFRMNYLNPALEDRLVEHNKLIY